MSNRSIPFIPGQRWISEAEPELGLGMVLSVEGRRATLIFPANGEVRQYAVSLAPLNRVRYAPGDSVSDGEGTTFVVESLQEDNGLLTYRGGGSELPEGRLSDQLAFSRPQDRLLRGHTDAGEAFELRYRVLERLHAYRSSPLRGLLGGRVSLVPHQLYVVESVVHRANPRVLLSDEIGLGKTIEACLILHRQLLLGRIQRALILVPPALVHQWFVELLRRFSLKVAIFDEERCEAIEANPEAGNPFLDDQLVLCDVEWLTESPKRTSQAADAGWDLLIVDEAHHLEWEPERPSRGYAAVETLARRTRGLLLLTATPEEMGTAGHFARLRLLDPDRYTSLKAFEAESEAYQELTPLVEALETGKALNTKERGLVAARGLDPDAERHELIEELIDLYGPGRVIFRNTRRIIKGFPKRVPHLTVLEDRPTALLDWLVALLDETAPERVLAIVHTREEAQSVYDQLKERTAIPVGLFHEEMDLLQRDRQAAWFANPEGARILIASEIGGEGRNFQFSHHLALLDIPENPEVLEQRVGRLDRIGQTRSIEIHVPYRRGTKDEVLALWVHEALDGFRSPLPGAHEIYLRFRDQLAQPWRVGARAWKAFIKEARQERLAIADRVAHGRDRLLELHSYRADEARHYVEAIAEVDNDPALEGFLMELFEAHGVHPEALEPRSWLLKPDPVFTDDFPGFPREGMTITFDRNTALSREDMGFMSWDHPLVHGAMERVLASREGNASTAVWKKDLPTRFLLDTIFVVEATATATDASRYLPAKPIRILVDDQGAAWTGPYPTRGEAKDLTSADEAEREVFRARLPDLLHRAEALAEGDAGVAKAEAGNRLKTDEAAELHRLKMLQKRNDHITDGEIRHRAHRLTVALDEIARAPLRLDALRWIWIFP